MIAQTFAQEQAVCRKVHFENALLADMERHGITDSLVNRERATAQLMRAKADMLLDAASRYPEIEGLSVAATEEAQDELAAAVEVASSRPHPTASMDGHEAKGTPPARLRAHGTLRKEVCLCNAEFTT